MKLLGYFYLIPLLKNTTHSKLIQEKLSANFKHYHYYQKMFAQKSMIHTLEHSSIPVYKKYELYLEHIAMYSNHSILTHNLYAGGLKKEIEEWDF